MEEYSAYQEEKEPKGPAYTEEAAGKQAEKPSGIKKVLKVVSAVFMWAFVALAVVMMILTIFNAVAVGRNDRSILGVKAYIVLSDSMKATDFDAGDMILSVQVDPTTLKEGDIISFISENTDSYGEVITHKIRRKTRNASGEVGFVTYGTTTDTDDDVIVTYPFIMGKYVFAIPKLGYFFQFMKTTPGYIVCIFIPFLILILYNVIKMVKNFKLYKKEQNKVIDEERRQIAEERQQSLELMKKLEELQAQLNAQNGTAAAAPRETAEGQGEIRGE